jgi:hypothetical protein|tara:strand:+ start:125 stop:586 length:462 start_codon:yes stop_codon:yes gene_type:complete
MKFVKYEYNNAFKVIPNGIRKSLEAELKELNPSPSDYTRKLRVKILDTLTKKGWSDPIRISLETKITITSNFKEIGLCLQTGNVGRFYADLLKLQTLFCSKKIRAGIYIIPTKLEAKRIGSNIANYERIVDELQVFSDTLTIPLIVYGFERRG